MQTQRVGPLPSWRSGCRQTSARPLLPRSSSLQNRMKSMFRWLHKIWLLSFEHQNCFLQLISLLISSIVPRGAEQAVPESTAADQVSQEPPHYQEEEEESYISEAMQEITDGTFLSVNLYFFHPVLFSLVWTVSQLLPPSKCQLRICTWSLANQQHSLPSSRDDPRLIFSGTR